MRTPITYYGGKQTMLKHILPLIPEHKIYTEAFCGGAAVFFAKRPAECEVINDINMHLVNFYNTLKLDYQPLKAKIDSTLHARDTHAHATHILAYPEFFDHVDRAWAVWALSKMSFASMLDGAFGYDFSGSMPRRLDNAKADFAHQMAERLERVTIESRHAFEVLETYDGPTTYHFVDPPYVGSDCGHYEGVFGDDDLRRLLELLTRLQGKWMLTMYPNSAIAEYADANGWIIHRVERCISAAKSSRRMQEEWMVCNYTLDNEQLTLF